MTFTHVSCRVIFNLYSDQTKKYQIPDTTLAAAAHRYALWTLDEEVLGLIRGRTETGSGFLSSAPEWIRWSRTNGTNIVWDQVLTNDKQVFPYISIVHTKKCKHRKFKIIFVSRKKSKLANTNKVEARCSSFQL